MVAKVSMVKMQVSFLFFCAILIALLLTPALAQERGTVLENRYVQSFNLTDINQHSARLYARATVPQARYAVDLYYVSFVSTNEAGNPIQSFAQLYIPRLSDYTEVPIYVMGSGTTGIGEQCATSREQPLVRNWGDYRAHMLSYATLGYIGILPDYQGFHDPQEPHYYFVANLEGRIMLDAVRAVYRLFERSPLLTRPSRDVFLTGYSQGGHAAFAASEMAPEYAPELAIRGVVGYAPAMSVEALMRDTPYLAPYILYAYSRRYGSEVVNPSAKLNARWLPTFERDVMTKCVDEVDVHYGRNWGSDASGVYQPEFREALYGGRLGERYPEFKAVLDINFAGLSRPDVPALVLQGGGDPIVSTAAQNDFVQRRCALGANLTYRIYPGVHHFQARQYSFNDTVNWMESILRGDPMPSDCRQILSQAQ